MLAHIKNGAVILPEEIRKITHIPENGECELIADEREIKILTHAPKPKFLLDLLRRPAKKIPSDVMIEMEVVEDD